MWADRQAFLVLTASLHMFDGMCMTVNANASTRTQHSGHCTFLHQKGSVRELSHMRVYQETCFASCPVQGGKSHDCIELVPTHECCSLYMASTYRIDRGYKPSALHVDVMGCGNGTLLCSSRSFPRVLGDSFKKRSSIISTEALVSCPANSRFSAEFCTETT